MIRHLLHCLVVILPLSLSAQDSLSVSSAEIESSEMNSSEIQFESFEINVSVNVLHFTWAINAEHGGDHYIIEKSIDTTEWTVVEEPKSMKDYVQRKVYSVSAINTVKGPTEIFRLVWVDKEGERKELARKEIYHPTLSNMLAIPSVEKKSKKLIVSYDCLVQTTGEIYVLNMERDEVFRKRIDFDMGYNRYELDINKLVGGKYVVFIKNELGGKMSKSFTVYDKRRRN